MIDNKTFQKNTKIELYLHILNILLIVVFIYIFHTKLILSIILSTLLISLFHYTLIFKKSNDKNISIYTSFFCSILINTYWIFSIYIFTLIIKLIAFFIGFIFNIANLLIIVGLLTSIISIIKYYCKNSKKEPHYN